MEVRWFPFFQNNSFTKDSLRSPIGFLTPLAQGASTKSCLNGCGVFFKIFIGSAVTFQKGAGAEAEAEGVVGVGLLLQPLPFSYCTVHSLTARDWQDDTIAFD